MYFADRRGQVAHLSADRAASAGRDAGGLTAAGIFVVDEAHTISEWGHSFRPSYLTLPIAIARLKRPTVLALTATATPWVRRDIVERIGLRNPLVVARGTDRPNLFLEVVRVEKEAHDKRVLRERLLDTGDAMMSGSGIIYAATTRATQETAAWLNEWGIAAGLQDARSSAGRRAGAIADRLTEDRQLP